MSGLALVTGADGFVGRHLVRQLLGKGYQVRALDHAFHGAPENGAERIDADILDRTLIAAVMEGVDIVFHLAAMTALWLPDEGDYQTVNVEGTNSVLQAAIAAGVARFVYCSSFVTMISGPRVIRTIDESTIVEPQALFGAYARSKRRAERLVMEAALQIEPVIVMPSAPIGPGDHNLTAPTAFLRDLVNGKIPATIRQITNFVDVELLADAILRAGERAEPGERYLLTGKNRPMSEFLGRVAAVSGLAMPSREVPYALAAFASLIEEKLLCRMSKSPPRAPYAGVRMAGRPFEFDSAKAMNDLDINLYPIDEALAGALLWLAKEGHLTRRMPALDQPQE